MLISRLATAGLIAVLLTGAVTPALAAPTADSRPERGLRMAAVEARYGAPTTRYPAVGKPAITRWDYPTMVVYFENDRLIHAVVTGDAPTPAPVSPAAE